MNGLSRVPIKVLYVEDDETIRMVGTEALRDAGFDVLEAKSADEAILLLSDPDDVGALFTDIRLPGTMDGIDLACETRKAYPTMPVLVASGYATQINERLRKLQPPVFFMKKPFSLDSMVSRMQSLTSKT
jgi:DNA-binding NtrC family response regulator